MVKLVRRLQDIILPYEFETCIKIIKIVEDKEFPLMDIHFTEDYENDVTKVKAQRIDEAREKINSSIKLAKQKSSFFTTEEIYEIINIYHKGVRKWFKGKTWAFIGIIITALISTLIGLLVVIH